MVEEGPFELGIVVVVAVVQVSKDDRRYATEGDCLFVSWMVLTSRHTQGTVWKSVAVAV